MKTPYRLILTSLLPLAPLSLVSCNSIDATQTTGAHVEAGVPGGQVSQTTTVRATVTGIDAASREVTLVTPEGKKFTVIAGPHVANFGQIRIGDQLKATYAAEVVIRMAKPGESLAAGGAAAVGLAPLGAKPGAAVGATHQFIGVVTAIDAQKHNATLQFSDGSSTTLPVRPDVDLSQRRVGEKVVFQTTEAVAISLATP